MIRWFKITILMAAVTPAIRGGNQIGFREAAQRERIAQSVRNGSPKRREAAHLRQEGLYVQPVVRHERQGGGGLTSAERARINWLRSAEGCNINRRRHGR